jgi:hypothetical protein
MTLKNAGGAKGWLYLEWYPSTLAPTGESIYSESVMPSRASFANETKYTHTNQSQDKAIQSDQGAIVGALRYLRPRCRQVWLANVVIPDNRRSRLCSLLLLGEHW